MSQQHESPEHDAVLKQVANFTFPQRLLSYSLNFTEVILGLRETLILDLPSKHLFLEDRTV